MQERENEAVGSPVPGNTPPENKGYCERGHDRVYAHRAGKHEIEVHEKPEKRRDADEEPGNERYADEHFAKGDEIRPQDRVRQNDVLEEPRVPPLHVWVCAARFRECALDESDHRRAGVVADPRRVVELTPPGLKPYPPYVYTHKEPERGRLGVREKEMGERRFFYRVCFHSHKYTMAYILCVLLPRELWG